MATRRTRDERSPLTRERVLAAALAIADREGIGALTIRALADELGASPMAIYYHVPGKEQILDGLVDLVFGEIEVPAVGADWRIEMGRRAHSARAVLRTHPWAVTVLESRASPGPATLRHHDAVVGCLRAGGFPMPLVAHAVAILDAFTYGFALEEAMLPFESPDEVASVAAPVLDAIPAGAYPNFVEFAQAHALQPGYDFGDEFAWGLELILDGIAAAARREAGSPA